MRLCGKKTAYNVKRRICKQTGYTDINNLSEYPAETAVKQDNMPQTFYDFRIQTEIHKTLTEIHFPTEKQTAVLSETVIYCYPKRQFANVGEK
jgi:3'-phosphoadenosine 5'-phosphosulfate (PAPS) 3'-phosphatase